MISSPVSLFQTKAYDFSLFIILSYHLATLCYQKLTNITIKNAEHFSQKKKNNTEHVTTETTLFLDTIKKRKMTSF